MPMPVMLRTRIVAKWVAYFVVPVVVGLWVGSLTTGRPFGTVVRGVLPMVLLWPLGAAFAAWYDIRRREWPPS